jgi:N12 class adenine-specific DNA methylase
MPDIFDQINPGAPSAQGDIFDQLNPEPAIAQPAGPTQTSPALLGGGAYGEPLRWSNVEPSGREFVNGLQAQAVDLSGFASPQGPPASATQRPQPAVYNPFSDPQRQQFSAEADQQYAQRADFAGMEQFIEGKWNEMGMAYLNSPQGSHLLESSDPEGRPMRLNPQSVLGVAVRLLKKQDPSAAARMDESLVGQWHADRRGEASQAAWQQHSDAGRDTPQMAQARQQAGELALQEIERQGLTGRPEAAEQRRAIHAAYLQAAGLPVAQAGGLTPDERQQQEQSFQDRSSAYGNYAAAASSTLANTGLGLHAIVNPADANRLKENVDQAYSHDPNTASGFLGQAVGNAIPILPALGGGVSVAAARTVAGRAAANTALTATGNTVAGGLAASQFGSVRMEVEEMRRNGHQISVRDELIAAAASAAAEFLGERLSMGSLRSVQRAALAGQMRNAIFQYGKNIGVNVTEEVATQIMQDAIQQRRLFGEDLETALTPNSGNDLLAGAQGGLVAAMTGGGAIAQGRMQGGRNAQAQALRATRAANAGAAPQPPSDIPLSPDTRSGAETLAFAQQQGDAMGAEQLREILADPNTTAEHRQAAEEALAKTVGTLPQPQRPKASESPAELLAAFQNVQGRQQAPAPAVPPVEQGDGRNAFDDAADAFALEEVKEAVLNPQPIEGQGGMTAEEIRPKETPAPTVTKSQTVAAAPSAPAIPEKSAAPAPKQSAVARAKAKRAKDRGLPAEAHPQPLVTPEQTNYVRRDPHMKEMGEANARVQELQSQRDSLQKQLPTDVSVKPYGTKGGEFVVADADGNSLGHYPASAAEAADIAWENSSEQRPSTKELDRQIAEQQTKAGAAWKAAQASQIQSQPQEQPDGNVQEVSQRPLSMPEAKPEAVGKADAYFTRFAAATDRANAGKDAALLTADRLRRMSVDELSKRWGAFSFALDDVMKKDDAAGAGWRHNIAAVYGEMKRRGLGEKAVPALDKYLASDTADSPAKPPVAEKATTAQPKAEAAQSATPAPAPNAEAVAPDSNKVFTRDRYEAAKAKLKAKLSQMNAGIDPELLTAGIDIAGYHIEKGARKFSDFARAMVEDLSEGIRPYLRSLYESVRHYPGMEQHAKEMSQASEIDSDPAPQATIEKEDTRDDERSDLPNDGQPGPAADQDGDEQPGGVSQSGKGKPARRPASSTGQPGGRGDGGRNGAGDGGSSPDMGSPEQGAAEQAAEAVQGDGGQPGRSERGSGDAAAGVNHVIQPGDVLAPRGPTAKFNANIKAIKLARQLKSERRNPTAEERAELVQYTGWGWGKEFFNESNGRYERQNKILKELLGEAEYDKARRSTLNAHYTSPEVITAIWDGLRRLGFKGGTVLEPAAGIGHFFGLMPQDMAKGSKRIAVELDDLSAGILKLLYPQDDVRNQGFEAANIGNNTIDAGASNVPFGRYSLPAKDYPKAPIHDYFFLRTIDKVHPGGIIAFVTSHFSLDKQSAKWRKLMAEKADLVGAIRLPNTAFQENASTEVTTDIIFLRKKDGSAFKGEAFINVAEVGQYEINGKDEPILVNEYFARHPEMVLGKHTLAGTQYGGGEYATVSRRGQDIAADLTEAIAKLPADVYGGMADASEAQARKAAEGSTELSYQIDEDGQSIIQVIDGKAETPGWIKSKWHGEDFEAPISKPEADRRVALAKAWIGLRNVARALFDAENTTSDTAVLNPMRKALNDAYDAWKKKNGTVRRRRTSDEPAIFMEDDPDYPLVQSLEDEKTAKTKGGNEVVTFVKSTIFTAPIRSPRSMPERVNSVSDAINISMGYRNGIDANLVAKLLGIEPEEAKSKLLENERVYEDPADGRLYPREHYLSGNVREKLNIAKEQAEDNPAYNRNVAALEKAQPATVPIGTVNYSLASRWIPANVLSKFAEDLFKTKANVRYSSVGKYSISVDDTDTAEIQTTHAVTQRQESGRIRIIDGVWLLSKAMDGSDPVITKRVWDPEKRKHKDVQDADAITLANAAIARMQEAFQTWSKTTEDTVEGRAIPGIMQEAFNKAANSVVPPIHDGSHLVFPGLSDSVTMKPHQSSGVARFLQEMQGVIAHGVGSGKTYVQIVLSQEMKRLGLAKKPLIVVQKATIGQFATSIRKAYPSARIFVANEKTFAKTFRKRMMARIATGEWDAVVITQPQFDRLRNSADSIRSYFTEKLDELEEAIRAERDADGHDDATVRQLETAKASLQARMQEQLDALAARQDDAVTFEEMGVDALLIDEAHAYKNIPIITRMTRVKGIPNGNSQRAMSMEMKAKFIQDRNNGKNVILATGTPITNTMAEAFVMLKLSAPNVLKDYGINLFDEWAHTFGTKASEVEYTWAGKWKRVTRFRKFINGPELITMIRSAFDVRMGNKELGLKVPAIKGGSPEIVVVKATEPMEQVNQWLLDIADTWNALQPKDKMETSWVPIVVMNTGMAAALDPRLVSPTAQDHPNSKVNTAVRRILGIYQAHPGKTQLVFADRFKPLNTHNLNAFAGGGPGAVDVDIEIGDDAETTEKQEEDESLGKLEEKEFNAAGFNLYFDMRDKLIKGGVPAEQIAIIHEHNTDKRREKLFADVNAGKVRILIGSTEKLGVGVNVQRLLVAMHHMDPPRMMTPAMQEQRDGRGIRQGNENDQIENIRYGTEKSMDTGIYQMLESKGRFVAQVLTGKIEGRNFEDAASELVLNMAQVKAALTGDPLPIRLAELQAEVSQLRQEKHAFESGIADNRSQLDQLMRGAHNYEESSAELRKAAPALLGKLAALEESDMEPFRVAFKQAADARERKTDDVTFTFKGIKLTRRVDGNAKMGDWHLSIAGYTINASGADTVKGLFSSLKGKAAEHIESMAKQWDGWAEENRRKIPAIKEALKATWGKDQELETLAAELQSIEQELLARDAAESASRGERLKTKREEKQARARGESPSLAETLEDWADTLARQVFEDEGGKTLYGGLPIGRNIDRKGLIMILRGAAKIVKGAERFTTWAKTMAAEFGEVWDKLPGIKKQQVWFDARKLSRMEEEELAAWINKRTTVPGTGETVKGTILRRTGITDPRPDLVLSELDAIALRFKGIEAGERSGAEKAKDRAEFVRGIKADVSAELKSILPPEELSTFFERLLKVGSFAEAGMLIGKAKARAKALLAAGQGKALVAAIEKNTGVASPALVLSELDALKVRFKGMEAGAKFAADRAKALGDTLRKILPSAKAAPFLSAIGRARTPAQIVRVLDRARGVALDALLAEKLAAVEAAMPASKFRKMYEGLGEEGEGEVRFRSAAKALLDEAAGIKERLKTGGMSMEDKAADAERLDAIAKELKAIVYQNTMRNKLIGAERAGTIDAVVEDAEARIKRRPPLPQSAIRRAFGLAPQQPEAGKVAALFKGLFFDTASKELEQFGEGSEFGEKILTQLRRGERESDGATWTEKTALREALEDAGLDPAAQREWANKEQIVGQAVIYDAEADRTQTKDVRMTKLEQVELLAHWKANQAELLKSGFDFKRIDPSGNPNGTYDAVKDQASIRNLVRLIASDRLVAKVAETIVARIGVHGPESNRVHNVLKGTPLELREVYYPIVRDQTAVQKGMDEGFALYGFPVLESSSFLQSRLDNTKPIRIGNALETFDRHIADANRFIHLAIPLRNARIVLENPNFKRIMRSRFGTDAIGNTATGGGWWADYLIDLAGVRRQDGNFGRRLIQRVGASILWGRPTTIAKQFLGPILLATEYRSAAEVKAFAQALAKVAANMGSDAEVDAELREYAAHLLMRSAGMGDHVVGTLARSDTSALKQTQAGRAYDATMSAGLAPLGWADKRTTLVAWHAEKSLVRQEHPDWSTEQILREAGHRASEKIENTQNPTTGPGRSAMGRMANRNTALAALTQFASQGNKVYNVIARSAMRNGATSPTFLRDAGLVGVAAAISAAITALLGRAGVQAAIHLARGEWDREDEDKMAKSFTGALLREGTGTMPLVGDAVEIAYNKLAGQAYGSGISTGPVGATIERALDSSVKAVKSRSAGDVVGAVTDSAPLVGIPSSAIGTYLDAIMDGLEKQAKPDGYFARKEANASRRAARAAAKE